MAINLVSLIMQFLTPQMTEKIAAALGVDKSLIGKAVTAAVPGLLGSLTGVASTSDGSRKLFQAVTQQDPNMLESLAGMLGGSGHQNLVSDGTSLLSSLLGGSATTALGGAIGKFAGLQPAASSSLLGILAPVVMGALGKQKAASALDEAGLAGLLSSQKSNISAALPAGFSDLLGGTGLLNSLGSGVAGAGEAAKAATQSAARVAQGAAQQASGSTGWLKYAIPAVVLVALGWWFFGRGGPNVADQAKTAATQATQAAQTAADQAKTAANQATQAAQTAADQAKQAVTQATQAVKDLAVGGVDIAASLKASFDGMTQSLQGITDVESAKAALPKLQDVSAQLDKVVGVSKDIPAAGKPTLAALIAAARPSIDELFKKVLAIPGVAEIAKPTIDAINGKLDALTKAAA
jgi:hypothetical protein